jgi:hypothetical protein
MNCCIDCFTSEYLRSIIKTNYTTKGNCDFCGNTNVIILSPVDLNKNSIFSNILDLYTANNINLSFNPKTIEQKISEDFGNKIFNIKNPVIVRSLLLEIIEKKESEINSAVTKLNPPLSLFKYPCHFEHLLSPDPSDILKDNWNEFVKEIKSINRFHIKNTLNLSLLQNLLKRHSKTIKKDSVYFRARICKDKTGYSVINMGSPPSDSARAGRANPVGISYLYLSSDKDTTLYETRASLYDYVSIGEFSLLKDIQVINLRGVEEYDPIQLAEQDDLKDFLMHFAFISKLEEELSKPIRKSDNDLDYLPTQYLCEYIKSLGYSGVEFKSSLNPKGHNLVIFSPELFDCITSYVHEVNDINYIYNLV